MKSVRIANADARFEANSRGNVTAPKGLELWRHPNVQDSFLEQYPYQEWLLRDWKRSGEYHYKIDRNQVLRKKLHRNGVSVEIANLGHFYGDPKALVQYVKDCDPSAIILNFCYSENSDSRWLLQRSGLLAKVFLKNERVLLTGNRTIQLDLEQEALLNEVEFKLEELRLMSPPGGPRPHVFIQGPAGKHAS